MIGGATQIALATSGAVHIRLLVGESIATWLMVGQNGLWTVIVLASGHIETTQPTLTEALAAIHQPDGDMAGQSPGPLSFR